MPKKVYIIADYIIFSEREGILDTSKVYDWLIDGDEAKGTVKDFIEDFGTNRMYSVVCRECQELKNISGNSIINNGIVCQDCRKALKPIKIKKPLKSLVELVPEVVDYWSDRNTTSPDSIYQNRQSLMRLWLICKLCGKEFSKSYESTVSSGCTCRSCTRRLNVPEEMSLKYLYPEVAKWYDSAKNILSSDKVSSRSNFKYNFICPDCGSVFSSSLNSVISSYKNGRSGCRVCAGYEVVKGFNDLSTKNEISYRLWDYEKNNKSPFEVLYSDQRFYWFKCEEGHSFRGTPFRILKSYNKGGKICPICSGREVVAEVNDVKTLNPLAYKYWDYDKNPDTPEEVYYHSDLKRWFKCDVGHSYTRCVSGMYRSYKNNTKGSGCIYCSGKNVESGVSDLKTLFPYLVYNCWSYEFNEVDPTTVHPYSGKYYWWVCTKCGQPFELDCDRRVRGLGLCEDCRVVKSISAREFEVFSFVKGYCEDAVSQVNFGDYSYDMYIPSKELVIEFNGIYYHSDAVSRYVDGSWNLKKYKELKERGISLLVIWEDDWLNKNQVCKEMLLRKLGVSTVNRVNARDCKVVERAKNTGIIFWNHIQGDVGIGCRYVSLVLGDDTVAELAYRYDKEGINIVRYATNCIVRGGFSKLLKFLKEKCRLEGYKFVYTFSDNSVSEGSLYKDTGFILESELKPDYMYVYAGKREHKFNFRKSRFKSDPHLSYEEGMSERELAALNGLYRVYDYGKKRWVLYVD